MENDKTLESSIEAYLRSQCIRRGWECLKLVSPGHRGMPDRMIVSMSGIVAFAELKRPHGGQTSALQDYWLADFARRGFLASVISSREEADAFISEIESETGGKER